MVIFRILIPVLRSISLIHLEPKDKISYRIAAEKSPYVQSYAHIPLIARLVVVVIVVIVEYTENHKRPNDILSRKRDDSIDQSPSAR